MTLPSEAMLNIVLLALGVYFSVLLGRGLAGYAKFQRVRPTALLTWPVRPPAHFPFLVALGVVSAAVALLNGVLNRPFPHVMSQVVMALYFILMVPLSLRIHLGFYRDGVWADTGFLPYAKIGRMAFRESPEIVLLLIPRGRSRSVRLPVPPEEYGAVRKMLEEKRREGLVHVDEGILGL
jgi:hypothetical protein